MFATFVKGLPMSRGSKRAVTNQHTGKTVLIDSCKGSKDWMAYVRAHVADRSPPILDGPVCVSLGFMFPRPRSHHRTRKGRPVLRADAPIFHAAKPDIDKLTRAILDALTGVAFLDDKQVSMLIVAKRYDPVPGVDIRVTPADAMSDPDPILSIGRSTNDQDHGTRVPLRRDSRSAASLFPES